MGVLASTMRGLGWGRQRAGKRKGEALDLFVKMGAEWMRVLTVDERTGGERGQEEGRVMSE